MFVTFPLIVGFGILGAAIFLTGFIKGVREAIVEYRNPQPESDWTDEGYYGASAFFAVLASAIVIALVGVAPAWIYAGPLLAIITAIGVGTAFLVGNKRPVNPTAAYGRTVP